MIRIGEVHCEMCEDPFEPEGLPSFEGLNFCSEECADDWEAEQAEEELNLQAYREARSGGASVHE